MMKESARWGLGFVLFLGFWGMVGVGRAPGAEGGDEDVAKRLAEELKPQSVESDEEEAPLAAGSILDTRSLWRCRLVRETPELVGPDGKVAHGVAVGTEGLKEWWRNNAGKGVPPPELVKVVPIEKDRILTLPADTPADWMAAEFDDGSWARIRGPMLSNFFSEDDGWKLILIRGRFEVTDVARAGELTLSMSFRGGVVVYLNGEEVHRAFMPKGAITTATPAEAYPESAYFTADGFVLPWGRQTTRKGRAAQPKEIRDRVASRTRKVEAVKLPAAKLRKGANVLAIAVHRAPTLAAAHLSRLRGKSGYGDSWWTKLGLVGMNLRADSGAGVVPNVGPAGNVSFSVWNHSGVQKVGLADYPEPLAPLNPLRFAGVRGGTFAGQLVVGDGKPIKGIRVVASELKGPGTLPASAVRVRYGLPDGGEGSFDTLEDVPRDEVAVHPASGRAVQPLWVTVTVPADAPGGDYTGSLTIGAEGVQPVTAPLSLRVEEWRLPLPRDYSLCMDFMQSPESVALAYDVPLWSDAHLKLLDRTFELLAGMANKTLFVTCIRRTHMGNEHAMVRWVRDEEGELKPDFTIVEQYLDVAMKHMGRIPGVILYCWEPPYSQGHAGGAGQVKRTYDKAILYSFYDPDTKELSPRQGPAWGTEEAKVFWKKLTDGIQPVLAKRGLKDSMLFGLVGDARPTKQAMDDICNGVPGARWAVHSHYRVETWQGYEMGMFIALWGLGYTPEDPSEGHSFGWSNSKWMSYYPREMSVNSTLTQYRMKAEAYIGARRSKAAPLALGEGPRGLGRIGADFWEVLKDDRGRLQGSLAGRFPESAWGQLNLNFGVPRVLGRGKLGPVPTVRSESFREAAQEIEARVYIEKALLDDAARTRLGDALVRRCRETLDERIRFANLAAVNREAESWFISSGWRERSEKLFALASEIDKRLEGHTPVPNLAKRNPEPAADVEKK